MSSIKTAGYDLLRRVAGKRLARRLTDAYRDGAPTVTVDDISAFQRGAVPAALEASAATIVPRLFAAHYGDADPETIIPSGDVGCARSYVPYVRGATNVVLFNFLGQNYGVRDPVLLRSTVLDGGRPVYTEVAVVGAGDVRLLTDPADRAPADLPAAGALVIEAFHPKVSTPAGQLRYIVLYRSSGSGRVAGVHSMPVFSEPIVARSPQPALRAYGPGGVTARYWTLLDPPVDLAVDGAWGHFRSDRPVLAPGYVLVQHDDGAVAGVWHDGVSAHTVEPVPLNGQRFGRCRTAWTVPDFERHAPTVLVTASQVGFPPAGARLVASRDGEQLGEAAIDLRDSDWFDTADVLPGLTGRVDLVLEFDRDLAEFPTTPACYVHLYYRGAGAPADQVHSHHSTGIANDVRRRPASYRCRKFAPLLADPSLHHLYTVVNVGGTGPNADQDVKVRVLTDRGEEFVVWYPVPAEGIATIDGDDLLERLGEGIGDAAVVQIEHETTNYSASWFAIDRATGHLAVDHFTGG